MFAGEVAQPQAKARAVDVTATALTSPRIARVGAASRWSAAYTAWGKIHGEFVANVQTPRGPPVPVVRFALPSAGAVLRRGNRVIRDAIPHVGSRNGTVVESGSDRMH